MESLTYKVELWPLSKIRPLANNPRTISKKEYARLKKRLQERGDHSIITVDHNGVCLSGNQRTKAMAELGWTEVYVKVPQREMSEEERQDVIVNSNISSGDFDFDILANEYMESIIADAGLISKLPDDNDVNAADLIINPKTIICPECQHEITLVN